MNRLYSRAGVFALTSALCLVTVGRLSAQATAAPAATKSEEETIVLSPFVVEASEDQGYTAKDTLAGTRVRTELKDVASAISVVTQQFLKDTGAKNSADLLVYTPSTEVAGIRGNFSGVAGTQVYLENTISSTTRVRGLDSADNTRDYFLTDIPWDGFNVGRVDLQRGPNSILFGIGSPAGIINTSVNDASFKTAYNVENRIDQYGSVRNSINLNQELVKGVLAIRVAAVKDNELYEQKPAFNNSTRFYGALRFDPKLFGEGNHTSLRVKYEDGKIDSNNPRSIPPEDAINPWFKTGQDAQGHYGYNKVIINQFNPDSPTPWGTTMAGAATGNYTNALALTHEGRSYWPDIINYYEQTPTAKNSVQNAPLPSGTPIMTIVANPITAKGIRDNGGGSLAGVNTNFIPLAIPTFNNYAGSIGTGNINVPGGSTPIPGGVFYADVVLQDPSIFNFYKKLLDGPNKKEWQNWKAFNAELDQSFFNDRFNFQVAFDHQDFTSGTLGWLSSVNYAINVDLNATYADGSPNPNVGRPYVANGASAPGLNSQTTTVRDSIRFTPTFELRTEDFLGNTTLAKILGKHNFTGVLERSTVKQDYVGFAEFATTAQYVLDNSQNTPGGPLPALKTLDSNRGFEWTAYLGPSLAGAASAKGANLGNLTTVIAPPPHQQAQNFNSTWNKPNVGWNALPNSWLQSDGSYQTPAGVTIPSGSIIKLADGSVLAQPNNGVPWYTNPTPAPAGYVDPTAPYTYRSFTDGTTQNVYQYQNPANYVGWTKQNIDWMYSSNPADYPGLVETANRTRYRNTSQAFTWQGYMFGGDFVPTVGWRKDVITSYQTNPITDQVSGYTSLNYPDDLSTRSDVRGESKSWGGVYHLPKSLTSKLPWDSTISLFYNRSSNFKADASRLSLEGLPIPNANGQTKEYGVTITTLNDKLSLKVDWFKTKVSNATLADTQSNSIGGLGDASYFLADGTIWGYGWATLLQDQLSGRNTNGNFYDAAGADGMPANTPAQIAAKDVYNRAGGTFTDSSGTTHTYVGGNAIIAAWLKVPIPSNYFASFHLSPPIDPTVGTRTGNLRDSYVTGLFPPDPNSVGGGSSFGNHQTTVDNLSNGIEVELNYQPVKNWNVTVNYTHVHATHENIDPVSQRFIGAMTAFMNGPGGQIREWYNGGTPLRDQWNSSIVAQYTLELNQLGHAAPEVSPWRLNLVSTYALDRGFAKGVFFGGALRLEAGRIIGYQYDPTFQNVNSNDPNYAAIPSLTLGGLNVNKPYIGANEHHVDAWVGYSRKITHNINWRVQVNVRSVGESDRLVASRINPDGSIALARIVQGMGYQLTNSFDF